MQTSSHQQPLMQSEAKQSIRNDFKELKNVGEKTQDWPALKPIIDRLEGHFNSYFASVESPH